MLICPTLLTNRVGTQISMRIEINLSIRNFDRKRFESRPAKYFKSWNPRPRLPSLACVELTLVVNFSRTAAANG